MSKSHTPNHRALAVAMTIALSTAFTGSAAAAGRVDTAGLHAASETSFDRFIVKYRAGTSAAAVENTLANAGRGAAKALSVGHLRKLAVGADVVQSNRALDRAEAESVMRQIAADPNVEYVEVDRLMHPSMTPNDPHYTTYQWDMQTSTGGIRADQAWNTTSGSGVVVAVLDTGYTNHSDLVANILPGYDFISSKTVAGDGNGRDADAHDVGDYYRNSNSSWHGTHVSGTIAAVGNNAKGVIGGAYKARGVPGRVLGRGGG